MRRNIMGLASVGAIFAAMASAALQKGVPENVETDDHNPKRRHKPVRQRVTPMRSESQIRNARMKRRWLEGQHIPQEDFDALEAAKARRERRGAKRALAARRTEEGMYLAKACQAYQARLADYLITRDIHTRENQEHAQRRAQELCGWDYIRSLFFAWDHKRPLADVETRRLTFDPLALTV